MESEGRKSGERDLRYGARAATSKSGSCAPKAATMSDNWGAEMCGKGVILGDYLAKKGSKRAGFWPEKLWKRHFLACGRGNWRSQRGISARIGHYVITYAGRKSTPGGGEKDENPATRGTVSHRLYRSPHFNFCRRISK